MQKPSSIMSEENTLSVSDLAALLKGVVETAFPKVKIRGEISGVKQASSGHVYFALKDDNAVIDAVAWRGQNAGFVHHIQDGLEVIVTGKITTYPMRSNYQIVIDSLEPAGEGALLKLLEELKQKLTAEGLFDESHKKKIPFLPNVIGVVTSPTGAVIRDIIHRVTDRFPCRIILWPCPVQGADAAAKVAEAVDGFNKFSGNGDFPRPDVLIVARGGGSVEDLWPFNEEIVVRAVARSQIPVISAVGHETDTTLIDYASDLRAPTPTGAAEFATPVRSELLSQITQYKSRLNDAINRLVAENTVKVEGLVRGLPNLSDVVEMYVQRLDEKADRMEVSMCAYVDGIKNKLDYLAKNLELCSYNRVLERGFALVTDKVGKLIGSVKEINNTESFKIKFADGEIGAFAEGVLPMRKSKKVKKFVPDDAQGSLW